MAEVDPPAEPLYPPPGRPIVSRARTKLAGRPASIRILVGAAVFSGPPTLMLFLMGFAFESELYFSVVYLVSATGGAYYASRGNARTIRGGVVIGMKTAAVGIALPILVGMLLIPFSIGLAIRFLFGALLLVGLGIVVVPVSLLVAAWGGARS
jgi:hypothetical protein